MNLKLLINGTFLMKPLTGVQRYASEMIKGFSKIGFSNILIIAPNSYKNDHFYGYRIIRDPVPFPWNNQWWLWEQLRLPLLIKEFKDYLLWSPTNTGPISVNNQVVTIHDAAVFAGPQWFSTIGGSYYRWLLPRLGQKVRRVITVSEFSKSELVKYHIAKENQISVVPCGISENFLKSNLKCNRSEQERYVLTLGSRDPRKNIRKLIEAWGKIDKDVKRGMVLAIVGGSSKGFANERLGSLEDDVKLLGYKTDEEIVELFYKTKVFVYPSIYEGFGLPPLEAMACGVPVIVSNAASLPEVYQNAALYCNPEDENDIANKIATLLQNDELRQQFRQNGLTYVNRFSWERAAEQLLNVLSEVVYIHPNWHFNL